MEGRYSTRVQHRTALSTESYRVTLWCLSDTMPPHCTPSPLLTFGDNGRTLASSQIQCHRTYASRRFRTVSLISLPELHIISSDETRQRLVEKTHDEQDFANQKGHVPSQANVIAARIRNGTERTPYRGAWLRWRWRSAYRNRTTSESRDI